MTAAKTSLLTFGNGLSQGANLVGSWANVSDANVASQPYYYVTTTAGDYFTATIPLVGSPPLPVQSVWLMLRVVNSNGAAEKDNISAISYSIDNGDTVFVDQRGAFGVTIDTFQFGQAFTRVLIPLVRFGKVDFSSGNRTIRVTAVGSPYSFQIDGLYLIAEKASSPAWGLTTDGDSWAMAGGADNLTYSKYPDKLATMLINHEGAGASLGQPFAFSNLGINGDMIVGQSGSAIGAGQRTGGTWRYINNFLASPTKYFTLLFGPNDLSQMTVGGFMTCYRNLLHLIEDTCELNGPNGVRVIVGTPGYRSPTAMMPSVALADPLGTGQAKREFGHIGKNYRHAVRMIRALIQQFPWLTIADIWAVIKADTTGLFPNASSPRDGGNHANAMYEELIAYCFFRAIIADIVRTPSSGVVI